MYTVELKEVPETRIASVAGKAKRNALPAAIRSLFDRFYAGFKQKGGLNVVYYPGCESPDEFDIECGVLFDAGNSALPRGLVATTTYWGPYDRMKPAHDAIHTWARENGRKLAGPSWEIYGHWSDDPAKLRTDIFYLVSQ